MVKMMKRLACLLLLALFIPCMALASPSVVDNANLFTADEVARMEKLIVQIREKYQIDAVVLTSYDAAYNDTQDFADLFYENGGYGVGEDYAGILYFIDMNNRVPCISTCGVMIDYITDSRLEELLEEGYDLLRYGSYGNAALSVLQKTAEFLEEGRLEGSFRYDAETGERLSGLYNALTSKELTVATLVGLVVAVMMYRSVSRSYSLKGNGTVNTAGESSFELTHENEKFMFENVVRTRKVESSSSSSSGSGGRGSSVHRSSSGRSHGGGVGRKF